MIPTVHCPLSTVHCPLPSTLFLSPVRSAQDLGILGYRNSHQGRADMAKVANEYAVFLLLTGGHREEIRFATVQDFQKWYSSELMPKSGSNEFITVPIKNIQGEYMVIRPDCILAIRVEPVFASSIDRDY
jgi:hypothetical protein